MGECRVKSVLLRLEGPMQSWGTSSRFDERDSALEPTKSGVVGLCAAALGILRNDDDELAKLATLSMAVRIDRPGRVATDFQTAGGGVFAGESYGVYKASGKAGDTVISQRTYLADASFLVALGGNDSLVDQIHSALGSPHWPLYLGRRAFVATKPIPAGIVEAEPVQALTKAPALDKALNRVRLLVEVCHAGTPRRDQPRSFKSANRLYSNRFVESREILLEST